MAGSSPQFPCAHSSIATLVLALGHCVSFVGFHDQVYSPVEVSEVSLVRWCHLFSAGSLFDSFCVDER